MKGEHILCHQAKGIRNRVDRLLSLYAEACLVFLVVAVVLSVALWRLNSKPTAVSLIVLSTAVTGYAYSSLLQRQQHIKDITDKTVEALRGRWDELRKDPDLLKFFASTNPDDEFGAVAKLKVRLYVATVLDMYAVIVHYINHGYFQHIEKFASIYEEMIKSFLRHPRMAEVWHSRDVWGMGCLRDEYGVALSDVVNNLIEEVEVEKTKRNAAPP